MSASSPSGPQDVRRVNRAHSLLACCRALPGEERQTPYAATWDLSETDRRSEGAVISL